MKEETKRQFDEVFNVHTRKLEEQRQVKVAKETKEEQFIRAFRERCAKIIKPALQRIGEYLLAKGMKTQVSETQESTGRDGRIDSREQIAIGLVITDDNEGRRPSLYEYPFLALQADKHRQLVDLHQSTTAPGRGGISGGIGSVKLEDVTEALLEEKVLGLVREVLK